MRKYFCNIKILLVFLMVVQIACSKTPLSPEPHEKPPFGDIKNSMFHVNLLNEDTERFTEGNSFQIHKIIGLDKAESNQTPWVDNSADIFRLAEKAMVLGNLAKGSERDQFEQFGHQLLQLFYSSTDNATQFDKTSTMYLKAALGFEGEKIMSMFQRVGNPANISRVQKIFDSDLKIVWPAQTPTLKPVEFIVSIKNYLNKAMQTFKNDHEVTSDFANNFTSTIKTKYLGALDQGEKDLQNVDEKQRLLPNVDLISKVMNSLSFIPTTVLDQILDQLSKAHNYGLLLQKKPEATAEDIEENLVVVLATIWIDLKTTEQREKTLKPVNNALYDGFTKLDAYDGLINWLASGGKAPLSWKSKTYYIADEAKAKLVLSLERSCHPMVYEKLKAWESLDENQKPDFEKTSPDLFEVFSHYSHDEIQKIILPRYKGNSFVDGDDIAKKFEADVSPICLNSVDDMIDTALNKYVLVQLDAKIRGLGSMVEEAVKNTTVAGLQKISDSVSTPEKFVSFFNGIAYPKMEEKLFDKTPTLPAIENARVQLYVSKANKLSTKAVNDGKFQTGADVIGESLSANYYRIKGMPEFENIKANDLEYMKYVFIQINKMLSMLGFRDFNKQLVPSLHRLFFGKHPEMDIYRYDCSADKLKHQNDLIAKGKVIAWREDCNGATDFNDDVYAIPDELAMAGAFAPAEDNPIKKASAASQADIIRGVAMMLQYFKDWGPNPDQDDYGVGMGQMKINDIVVFPRPAFVNLTVGLITTPVRGFKKPHTQLKLFNVLGDEIQNWIEKDIFSKDPIKVEQRKNDPSLTLAQAVVPDFSTEGTSHIIHVKDLASYIIAIDEFLNSMEGIEKTKATLINPLDHSHEVLDALNDGRKQLKMLMYGMSGFLISRMQDQDGGFWDSYSLDTHQVTNRQPRTLEDQEMIIEAMMRVYNQWHNGLAVKAATEAYYFMNKKLWSDDSHFYATDESVKETVLNPITYLDTMLAIRKLIPYLKDQSQVQAQKIYDFYSGEFLNWNKTNQPFVAE